MKWITKWKQVCSFCPEQYTRIVKHNGNFYTVMITFRRDKYWNMQILATGKHRSEIFLYDYHDIDISGYGFENLLEHQHAKCKRLAERTIRNFFKKNPDFEPINKTDEECEREIISEMMRHAHEKMV